MKSTRPADPRYIDYHGSICLQRPDGTIAPPVEEAFAILFDATDGTVHKYGSAKLVRPHFDRLKAIAIPGVIDPRLIEIPVEALTQVVLATINSCIARADGARDLETRLLTIAGSAAQAGAVQAGAALAARAA